MAFGFIGDIVEQVGEVLLPRGTRGATIGAALGGAPGAALGAALTSDIATGRRGQEAVASTGSMGARETSMSGEQTGPYVYRPSYTAGFTPRLPGPTTTQPGMRDMAGTVLDIVYDVGESFFGSNQSVCATSLPKLVTAKQRPDGSYCLSVTRKQQHMLKSLVGFIGIEAAAQRVGLSVGE